MRALRTRVVVRIALALLTMLALSHLVQGHRVRQAGVRLTDAGCAAR